MAEKRKKGRNKEKSEAPAVHTKTLGDGESFVKFPRTRHLFDAGGGVGRDDLVMDEKEAHQWYSSPIIVEEKVDGSNLGMCITNDWKLLTFNRSHPVTTESHSQFKLLDQWVKLHPGLWQVLTSPDIILYGEWLYAKHSIHYTRLPDTFLAFDIFDKTVNRFLSRAERDRRLEGTGIHTVPLVAEGVFTRDELRAMLDRTSAFYDGPLEGVYLRRDSELYLEDRCKIVRPDFLEKTEDGEVKHWATKTLVKNVLLY